MRTSRLLLTYKDLLVSSDLLALDRVEKAGNDLIQRHNVHILCGYGDADPSNVSTLVHGAELRIAETRAVMERTNAN